MVPTVADGRVVAYFSMEIAISDAVPTFSGGLGVLAADHLRSAADLGLPLVGVTLLYHQGFFRQALRDDGEQVELAVHWSPTKLLERVDEHVEIVLGGHPATVGAWRLDLQGVSGHRVPVYFLDTALPGNDDLSSEVSSQLYTGNARLRLTQEAVLGLAGVAMLEALGYDVCVFHMNEGHAALAPVAVLDRTIPSIGDATAEDLERVRRRCVFTSHTPVSAGHDRFPRELVGEVLGTDLADGIWRLGLHEGEILNMTDLGMFLSGFANGVAERHGHVAQAMFPQYRVRSITNGIHVGTWAARSTATLLDRHIPRWREDNALLRYCGTIPLEEVAAAHEEAKHALIDEVVRRTGTELDPTALTIGVARRVAAYKRNDLLLADTERLRALVEKVGPLQIVYSGKAHPQDGEGKQMIAHIFARARELAGVISIAYVEDYGLALAAVLCAGVDVWLNTPVAPYEASGTSGMKAAVNGVPSLSILDGWWVEGHIEGVTGWAIGPDPGYDRLPVVGDTAVDAADGSALHHVLAATVAPLYYGDPAGFTAVRRGAMALNGSFFTTHRMVREYASVAYGLDRPLPMP